VAPAVDRGGHQALGDLPGALAVCEEGLSLAPDDGELLFRKAVVHRTSGQPAEAEVCWRRILTLRRPEKSLAWIRVSTDISPSATWPRLPRSAGTSPSRSASGGPSSKNARATARPWPTLRARPGAPTSLGGNPTLAGLTGWLWVIV
jgi:hypothetical protein